MPAPTDPPNISGPTPSAFALSGRDWKAVISQGFRKSGEDNLGLAAAGVAFYAFLAIVPLLLSAVLVYGLVVETATVARHIAALAETLPGSATAVIQDQLEAIVAGPSGKKGLGLAVALAVALFSARNGAAAVITGLGIAYDCADSRSFVRRTALALLITVGAIAGGAMLFGAMVVLAALGALVPGLADWAIAYKLGTYVFVFLVGMAAAGVLYRYGPDGAEPCWRWATPGSAFAATGWLIITLVFGIYAENFGNYQATYGSLSAIIILLTWLYLSAYVLLLGAEFNAAARQRSREA